MAPENSLALAIAAKAAPTAHQPAPVLGAVVLSAAGKLAGRVHG